MGARRFTSSALSIESGVKSSTRPLAGSAALATSTSTTPAASASRAGPSRSARSTSDLDASLAQARPQRSELLVAAAAEHDLRAASMERAGDLPADASGRPGHERSGSPELHEREATRRACVSSKVLRAPIHLGLQIPNFNFPDVGEEQLFERLSDIAATAESSGFDTVLVMDHLHQIRGVGPPENWMLEGNTILAALAARTRRVNLEPARRRVTYRNPALHAKVTTTLDVISGGRAVHGIGAGWNVEEATAYGYDFPSLGERFERLEDHLNIARAMFTQSPASYQGKHHSIDGAFNNPQPIRGDIPIMIGGSGEKKTLRMVAQYADASNFFGDAEGCAT